MKKLKINIKKILLWSQKYTKADMLYIARGGFWVIFGQVINGVLSLILVVAFANLLPKEMYGTYRYILSIAGILNVFTLTGMNSAVSRTVARGEEGVLKPMILYQLKWNSLMLVALFLLSAYYHIEGDDTFALSFLILGFFVPFTLAFNTYSAYLEGKKKFNVANILSILSTLTYSIGMYVALLLSNNVVWLILIYTLTTFIPSCLFFIYTIRTFKPPHTTDTESTVKYGWKLTFIRLLGPITSQIDKIILAHFWGPLQLATYSIATTMPSKAVPALKNVMDIGFPKFAVKTPQEINTVFFRRIFQGMFFGAGISVLYTLLAPYLFTYLLPQYTGSVFYSQILSVSFIFALPNRYISLLFESQKMTRVNFINNIINSIVAVVLYTTLGIFTGLLGLVIASVLYPFLSLIINIVSWKIHHRVLQ